MNRYKKVIGQEEVQAVQLTLENLDAIADWMGDAYQGHTSRGIKRLDQLHVYISTLNERIEEVAQGGDWIIKDSDGEFYSCNDLVFNMDYERVWRDENDAI